MAQSRSARREGEETREDSGEAERSPESLAVARKISIRASRPTDGKHAERMHRLVQFCLRHEEIADFRSPELLEKSVVARQAILAVRDGVVVGFGAAHVWDEERYVSHSPILVDPEFRDRDLDDQIKRRLIGLTRRRWPQATMLGLTQSVAVEELDQRHGYEPVPYCDLTTNQEFWEGCRTCEHYGHLKRNQYQDCHCWAGLLRPPGAKPTRVIPKDALKRPRPELRYRAGG